MFCIFVVQPNVNKHGHHTVHIDISQFVGNDDDGALLKRCAENGIVNMIDANIHSNTQTMFAHFRKCMRNKNEKRDDQ